MDEAPQTTLSFTLLGIPGVFLNDQPVTGFVSNKAVALLYYLAATGQPASRATLASLLWGDFSEKKARKNLRDVLSNLRHLLPECLLISLQDVAFHPQAKIGVDVKEFEDLFAPIEGSMHETLTPAKVMLLREAMGLYQGEFLDGFELPQAPDFEMWVVAERSRLQYLALQALHVLTEYFTKQGNTALGIKYAMELLKLEPWREETHCQLMCLLVWSGQRSAALAQYEVCRRALAESLGVEPQVETRQLYKQILQGEPLVTHFFSSFQPASFMAAPVHNLPAQPTPFVGREAELAEIIARLQNSDCRLLTVVGPGGVGKTRLALEAANQLLDEAAANALFADGIFFVKLASAEGIDSDKGASYPGRFNPIAAAVADALQLTLSDPDSPTGRLQNYLREKEMLLIMDNFEHLVTEAGYLSSLMRAATGLKILVTSRSRLGLRGEHVFLLEGLPVPMQTAVLPSVAWQGYAAVALFLQTARSVYPDFVLRPGDETAVTRICQLVNGLPLGIELAATWVRILSCREIVAELQQSLRFLQASRRDGPEQHRSLWAVFTYSWNMLTDEEQQACRRLSVFRGGFTREAAKEVAEVSLPVLTRLIDHSFVRRFVAEDGLSRFEILEVIRLYAADQLQQNPSEGALVFTRHQAYFVSFLANRQNRLQSAEQRLALEEIGAEIENVRAAWRWSVLQQDLPSLDKGLTSLFDYYDMRSRFQEGRDAFQRAAEAVAETGIERVDGASALGRLRARQGWFTFHIGQYAEAITLLAQSVELLRPLAAPTDLIFSLNYQGAVHYHLGDQARAEELCQEALALSEGHDFQPGAGIALNILSQIAYRAQDYERAQAFGKRSLGIVTALGNPWSRAFSLSNLARVAFARQEYAEAERLCHIILSIRQEMGDLRGVAMCLEELAQTALAQNRETEAIHFYQHSLALFRDIGSQRGIVATLMGLGCIALDQEKSAWAQSLFAEALERVVTLPTIPETKEELVTAVKLILDDQTAAAIEEMLRQDASATRWPELARVIAGKLP